MFIVLVLRADGKPSYISAPAGYASASTGGVYRDGTDPHKSSPEESSVSDLAYRFKTHRSAARQANKFIGTSIQRVGK